jgi:hypothetical protein
LTKYGFPDPGSIFSSHLRAHRHTHTVTHTHTLWHIYTHYAYTHTDKRTHYLAYAV